MGIAVAVLLLMLIPASVSYGQVSKVPVIILFNEEISDKHIDKIKSNQGDIKKSWKIIDGLAVDLPSNMVDKLREDPSILSIDADVEVRALDLNADIQVRADQVWLAGNTGQGVPVAILDTGIDSTHPEFTGRIAKCHNEFDGKNTCIDENNHGTHVAGILGASGVVPSAKGVAPQATFYIDKVLDKNGSGSISGIISGIDWAVANNAKIISMSLGTSPISTTSSNCDSAIPSLTTAVNNAVSAGVTVIAAAGNSGSAGVGAPACISGTIAVAAVDSADSIASFSSRGGPVADHGIAAPGVSIYSSLPGGGYGTLSGTSMATPVVSGTVALMLESNSSLTPAQIKSALFSTACTNTTNPSCPTGSVPNTSYGFGRVDALRAVSTDSVTTVPNAPILSTTGKTETTISISWTTPANGGSAITGYTYQWSTNNFASILGSTSVSSATNSATISGLSPSTSYNIRVFATNAIGNSAFSNVLTVTTLAPPGTVPTISINNVSKIEGNSGTKTFVFTVTRSGDTTVASSVNFATDPTDGTATAGSDYVSNSGTLNFAGSEITKSVAIVVNGDTTVEPNETFFVNLSTCVTCSITDNQGLGTIRNNDR